jgi:hypothetical protein
MSDAPQLAEVTTLRKPNEAVVAELEGLLAQAKAGHLRGLLFVAYYQGTNSYRYGLEGEYSLPELAMGIKLMDLEFNSLVTHNHIPDADG